LAVKRKALPKGIPFQTGGGTARLVSPGFGGNGFGRMANSKRI
jgi:hypothetical protein